jgi:pyruvate dehydrogenase (quinone)
MLTRPRSIRSSIPSKCNPSFRACLTSDTIAGRYPGKINSVGDAKATLWGLLPLLEYKTEPKWREGIESDVARWWQTMDMEAGVSGDPINPMKLFAELSPRLPDDVIVTAGSGSSAN